MNKMILKFVNKNNYRKKLKILRKYGSQNQIRLKQKKAQIIKNNNQIRKRMMNWKENWNNCKWRLINFILMLENQRMRLEAMNNKGRDN